MPLEYLPILQEGDEDEMSTEIDAVADAMEASRQTTVERMEALPPLMRDPSFWGMTVTQFLGAFNDNVFRQLIFLLCLDYSQGKEDWRQAVAVGVFAIPFVLFSGIAGFLADKHSKRNIVVLAKVAEIVIMFLGVFALSFGYLIPMYFVLFLMSVQSAFFGPPKYGILPEMIRQRDLPRANGIFLMTTFLAIIFGLSAAGALKEAFQPDIWLPASVCVLVAIVGTLTSLVIRPTPIAQPDLKFEITALAIPTDMRRVLMRDRQLLGVLLATSLFWMIGSIVYPPAVNSLGKKQMELDDRATSIMAACTGLGIAVGCVIAGKLSRNKVRFGLVRLGSFGLIGSMLLLAAPGVARGGTLLGHTGSIAALIALGVFAGFFSVPLQVFLQARAPENLKGRIIAAMNLTNWIGIMFSSVVYFVINQIVVLLDLPVSSSFALCAIMLLPVAIFYRPADAELK